MTRPTGAAQRFVKSLPADAARRVAPIFSPLIHIAPTDATVTLGPHDAAIFSSANGVAHSGSGEGRAAFCVGQATTDAANAAGWKAHFCGATAQACIAYLVEHPPKQRLFHLHGVHTRGAVADHLATAGLSVESVAIYDQKPVPLTDEAQNALTTAQRVLVPLFSPRTAQLFLAEAQDTRRIHAIALSAAVAAPIRTVPHMKIDVAAKPDAASIRAALVAAIAAPGSG